MTNIPNRIKSLIGRNLYEVNNNPICITKEAIFSFFKDFEKIKVDSPYVSTKNNFDDLLVSENHVSRQGTDTFYLCPDTVLRTHMTAYLSSLGKTHQRYIVCGDVYRRDAIDRTHFPVFHQIDGFCIVEKDISVEHHLRETIRGLIEHLFGSCDIRLAEDTDDPDVYFPFTINSFEAIATVKGKEIELLGAGTVHPTIMENLELADKKAWAFGLGLERLAMLLFDIPDIRLFWCSDKRFAEQFTPGKITQFSPFSKYEKTTRDIAFFSPDYFCDNDFYSLVREMDTEGLVEEVTLIDTYQKNGKTSNCYRITYRAMDRTLTNEEINDFQSSIRNSILELGIELR